MNNLKLGTKIFAGFLLTALIALVMGVVGLYGATKLGEDLDLITTVKMPAVRSLLGIEKGAEAGKGTLRTLAIQGLAPDIRARQFQAMARIREEYTENIKHYEGLPRTIEEEQLWRSFVPLWNTWRDENSKFLELTRQADALGIPNPQEMGRLVEKFTKDHYIAVQRALHLVHLNESFEGGDDHTGCNLGKWLPSFKSSSQAMNTEIDGLIEPHKAFHAAIKKIKHLSATGRREEAQSTYTKEMLPAMALVFQRFGAMIKIAEQAIDLGKQANNQLLEVARVKQVEAIESLNKVSQSIQKEVDRSVQKAKNQASLVKTTIILVCLLGLMLAVALGFLITRALTRPVLATVAAMGKVSQGDFTFQLDQAHLRRGDEIGELLRDVNKMADTLSATLEQVALAAESVSSGASQISQGNQDLSERTQQQASAIEETASALEQLTSSVKQNAANSSQANNLAKNTASMASEGGKVLERTVAAMRDVTESSKKIADIINVVNEIAFQTNLLALNAAVEAARAGDAGRGFAVVAGEVRNLAGRSASAAKEIQALIGDSVAKVEQGNNLVAESGRLLSEIITNVQTVADTIGEISSASQEQASGIDEINKAVNQLDEGVQNNAALVEEAASASENMAASAEELHSQVSQFKLRASETNSRVALSWSDHER